MDANILKLYLGCRTMVVTSPVLEHLNHTSKLNEIDLRYNTVVIGDEMVSLSDPTRRIKLLLRPLESMTDEEKLKLYQFGFTYNRKGLKIEEPQKWHCFKPEQFQWLCSEGFDLFGLIEKGEAIDATKETIYTP